MQEFNEKYAWLNGPAFPQGLRIILPNEDFEAMEDSLNWQVFDYRDDRDGKIKQLIFPTFFSAITYIRYEK